MRYVFLTIALLLSIAAFVLAATNNSGIEWNFFGSHTHLAAMVVVLSYYVVGLLIPLSILGVKREQNVSSSKHLAEWQKQDVKLAAEITSDREKQLEAKIATLETALKSALKKQ